MMNTRSLDEAIAPYQLNSCMISRAGQLIYSYEKYDHISLQLGPINSCTKSILSALICMAMDKGLLPSPDTFIYEFFPKLLQAADERKQSITMKHLLTMTPGFQWNEFGGIQSFPTMTRSSNWIDFVLEQPMSDLPGTKMVYNSGASQLLAAILASAIDLPIAAYAEEHLFGPLGIQQYQWKTDPQGIHAGGFGINLSANDMMKFGLLYLKKGVWNNEKIISKDGIRNACEPFIAASSPDRGYYSWHWWTDTMKVTETSNVLDYYYARGFGGQFIFIIPQLETVVVTTRTPRKKGLSPIDLLHQHIIPFVTLT